MLESYELAPMQAGMLFHGLSGDASAYVEQRDWRALGESERALAGAPGLRAQPRLRTWRGAPHAPCAGARRRGLQRHTVTRSQPTTLREMCRPKALRQAPRPSRSPRAHSIPAFCRGILGGTRGEVIPQPGITSRSDDRYGAATVTWVSQASFKPPLIMAAVQRGSNLFQCPAQSRVAALHIVGDGQQDIARRFFYPTHPESGSINGEPFAEGRTSAPILASLPAHVGCEVERIVDTDGDQKNVPKLQR